MPQKYQRKPKSPLPRSHPKYHEVCHTCWDEPRTLHTEWAKQRYIGQRCLREFNRLTNRAVKDRHRARGDTVKCRLCGRTTPWSQSKTCTDCKQHSPEWKLLQENKRQNSLRRSQERWPFWVERAFMRGPRPPLPPILQPIKPKHPTCQADRMRIARGYRLWYGRVRRDVARMRRGDKVGKTGRILKQPFILGNTGYKDFHARQKQHLEARKLPRSGYQSTF